MYQLLVRPPCGLSLAWDKSFRRTIPSAAFASSFACLVTCRDWPKARRSRAGAFRLAQPGTDAGRRLGQALWQICRALSTVDVSVVARDGARASDPAPPAEENPDLVIHENPRDVERDDPGPQSVVQGIVRTFHAKEVMHESMEPSTASTDLDNP